MAESLEPPRATPLDDPRLRELMHKLQHSADDAFDLELLNGGKPQRVNRVQVDQNASKRQREQLLAQKIQQAQKNEALKLEQAEQDQKMQFQKRG